MTHGASSIRFGQIIMVPGIGFVLVSLSCLGFVSYGRHYHRRTGILSVYIMISIEPKFSREINENETELYLLPRNVN